MEYIHNVYNDGHCDRIRMVASPGRHYDKPRHIPPSYGYELLLGSGNGLAVAGIDEVGRGALAGPVVAAAVILTPAAIDSLSSLPIRDSKQLSRKSRQHVAQCLRASSEVTFYIAHAGIKAINTINILQATHLAMRRAITALKPDACLVDGNKVPARLPCPGESLVHGDQISVSIASASILAKVWRDSWMQRLAKIHPEYEWEKNAGYGTLNHRRAIKRHGVTRWHRQQFVSHLISDPSYSI